MVGNRRLVTRQTLNSPLRIFRARRNAVRADGRDLRQIGRVEGATGSIEWSADGRSLYLSSLKSGGNPTVWKANADGSHFEKLLDGGCLVTDASVTGRYML